MAIIKRKGKKELMVPLPLWEGGSQMIFDEKRPGNVVFRVSMGGKESERYLDLETLLLLAPRIMKAAMLGLEAVSFTDEVLACNPRSEDRCVGPRTANE